jgi:N-acetyl-gamma-glutamyl-phosphate reductase
MKIHQAYAEAFAKYPLVRWDWMRKSKTIVNMKYVVGTPLTQIGYEFDDENVYLFSQLDNLMKGAASQAVENLNLIYNLKPETGFVFNTEKV